MASVLFCLETKKDLFIFKNLKLVPNGHGAEEVSAHAPKFVLKAYILHLICQITAGANSYASLAAILCLNSSHGHFERRLYPNRTGVDSKL